MDWRIMKWNDISSQKLRCPATKTQKHPELGKNGRFFGFLIEAPRVLERAALFSLEL